MVNVPVRIRQAKMTMKTSEEVWVGEDADEEPEAWDDVGADKPDCRRIDFKAKPTNLLIYEICNTNKQQFIDRSFRTL